MRFAGKGYVERSDHEQVDPVIHYEDLFAYPGLTGMVFHVPNFYPGLLPQLTFDGVLESLPGFHETRECRIVGRIPFRLANENYCAGTSQEPKVYSRSDRGEFCHRAH